MTTEPPPPPPPPSETEKLQAALNKLVAEREQRQQAGKWSRGTLPVLQVLVADDETGHQAQERALASIGKNIRAILTAFMLETRSQISVVIEPGSIRCSCP